MNIQESPPDCLTGRCIIRPARPDDLPDLLQCGVEFLEAGAQTYAVSPNPEELRGILVRFLAHPDMCVLVAERDGEILGGLVGTLTQLWFAPTVSVAAELAWFVRAHARGGAAAVRLLRAFESWAATRHVAYVTVSCIPSLKGDAVATLFARAGYHEAERAFLRRI